MKTKTTKAPDIATKRAGDIRTGQSVVLRESGCWEVAGQHPDGAGKFWLHRRTDSGTYETHVAHVREFLPPRIR